MFLGHFGVAFGAKAAAPKTSLGTLFLAALFIDLLWPTFLLLGIERVRIIPGITAVVPLDFEFYPFSHSLASVLLWSLGFGFAYRTLKHDDRGAFVLGLAVLSHWFLDAIVHRPDLPLYPGGGPRIGLGLWASLSGTLVVELLIFGAGLGLYLRRARACGKAGSRGLVLLVGFLLLVYLANLFGSPPPNVAALAWAGQAQWLLVFGGLWLDRHRQAESVNG